MSFCAREARTRRCGCVVATVAVAACADERSQRDESAPSREELDQLGLTRDVPERLVSACSKAARKTKLVVYCPSVVPKGPLLLDFGGNAAVSSSGYILSMRSERLADRRSNLGHWAIEADRGRRLERQGIRRGGLRRAPESQQIRLAGKPATIVKVQRGANSFHKGHVVVFWRFAGVGYDVSLHGHDNLPQAKAIAANLIRQMRSCSSGPAEPRADCRLVFGAEGAGPGG